MACFGPRSKTKSLDKILLKMDFVHVSCEGRSLKMRPSQLTVNNIGKAFRLAPDSLLLVSETGTVALPDVDGLFGEVDSSVKWKVEGEGIAFSVGSVPGSPAPSATPLSLGLSSSASACFGLGNKTPGISQWKPRSFPLIATQFSKRKVSSKTNFV